VNSTSEKLEKLIHAVNMKRYATGNPKDAFRALMEEVEHKVHHFRKDCWNITLELLADHLGLMRNPWQYVINIVGSQRFQSLPNLTWKGDISEPSYQGLEELKKQIPVDLIEAYIAAAKANPWDYPGEIFIEDELAGKLDRLGQVLTPRCIVDFMVKACMDESMNKKSYSYTKPDISLLLWQTAEALEFNDKLPINLLAERARRHTVLDMTPLLVKYEPKPITDLDPCVGSGRFLLEATLMYPKAPLLLYGVEIDRSLYRACLVNMAMFSNHPYFIICADTLRLDMKYSADVSSPMWGLGNQWDPPDMTPYYFKIAPPFKFTLKDYAMKQKADRAQENKQAVGELAAKQVTEPEPLPPVNFTLREYALLQKVKRASEKKKAVEELAAKQAIEQ